MQGLRAVIVVALTLGLVGPGRATLNIEITKSLGTAFPIAIVPFAGDAALPPGEQVSTVIRSDLVHSGRFAEVPDTSFLSHPHHAADVVYKDWRIVKADALVIGSVTKNGSGPYTVVFRLYDVFNRSQLAAFRYVVPASELRQVAHEISDDIYLKLLGVRGAFNTRIAYVERDGVGYHRFIYELKVADSDGYHPQTILRSTEPIISPAWSPDGQKIAYVSYEHGRSMVFVENVATGQRFLVAATRGINGAPAWAPDGTHLALMLGKDGNAEIYVLNLATGHERRLTFNPAIDTEPTWSPDGRTIAFTSDRSGNPQIYLMNSDGGDVRRLTFDGRYNADAVFDPDGQHLAIVSRAEGAYHIALLNLKDSSLTPLTQTRFDESPSFAPNGQTILFDTLVGGRRVLATVSVDGNVQQVIRVPGEDISNPAWSPYLSPNPN